MPVSAFDETETETSRERERERKFSKLWNTTMGTAAVYDSYVYTDTCTFAL